MRTKVTARPLEAVAVAERPTDEPERTKPGLGRTTAGEAFWTDASRTSDVAVAPVESTTFARSWTGPSASFVVSTATAYGSLTAVPSVAHSPQSPAAFAVRASNSIEATAPSSEAR